MCVNITLIIVIRIGYIKFVNVSSDSIDIKSESLCESELSLPSQTRDAPVPVPDWVTGYQSDRSPSRTGYPVGLVPSPDWVPSPTGTQSRLGTQSDWVTGPTGTQSRLGLPYFKIHKFFLAVQSRSTLLS